jgi:hypothetical protein
MRPNDEMRLGTDDSAGIVSIGGDWYRRALEENSNGRAYMTSSRISMEVRRSEILMGMIAGGD